MNTEKTRILTSTHGHSTVDKLRSIAPGSAVANSLERAIQQYSRDKKGNPVEVKDGLRVLGVPVGSDDFCRKFIMEAMAKAASEASAVISGLESEQTMLQLFRQCTTHKLTHLFAADVVFKPSEVHDRAAFPVNWDC